MLNSGYTLPVFACASAVASLRYLQSNKAIKQVEIDLINPDKKIEIDIEQIAKIENNKALAITRSNPGDNLDLTRNTPIWALVKLTANSQSKIIINGGEGVGKIIDKNNEPAIYKYAKKILEKNLLDNLKKSAIVEVEIILPEGKDLAKRTSNSAFGVIDGLSLLGTTGISQPLTSPEQLKLYQQDLIKKAQQFDDLLFCIGENGLSLAYQLGFNQEKIVKTANWIGSMLVTAAEYKVKSITLLGYHGKLIKLAGGIFHTHHHLADGRLEILTAISANCGLPSKILRQIFTAETTESALQILKDFDSQNNTNYQEKIYQEIKQKIMLKSEEDIAKHSNHSVIIDVIIFDRQRQII